MKKLSGILLVILGAAIALFMTIRAIGVLMIFFGGADSAYGIGFLTGTIIITFLFLALAWKSVKKGMSLIKG